MQNAELKKAGLKITVPRVRIMEIMDSHPEQHLSAEDVYRALLDAGDEVGIATVYRVLTQFETAGIVSRHHFEGDYSVFELEDGEHHDHLVDIATGKVVEFYDEVIEQRQKEIAHENDFTITGHTMILYGTFNEKN